MTHKLKDYSKAALLSTLGLTASSLPSGTAGYPTGTALRDGLPIPQDPPSPLLLSFEQKRLRAAAAAKQERIRKGAERKARRAKTP